MPTFLLTPASLNPLIPPLHSPPSPSLSPPPHPSLITVVESTSGLGLDQLRSALCGRASCSASSRVRDSGTCFETARSFCCCQAADLQHPFYIPFPSLRSHSSDAAGVTGACSIVPEAIASMQSIQFIEDVAISRDS